MSGPDSGFHLDVGDGHRVWVAPWGNPQGAPIVFLHGGPGSGCQPFQRSLFDAERHHVIFADQRGAGRSLPHRAREANETPRLVADLEAIRAHFGFARWLVVGGSWGATLALAYAQAHPERVSGLALRAVFLGTRAELDWAFGAGPATFFPALYADFLALLTPEERADPLAAYWRRILDPAPEIHGPAAWAWHDLERALSEIRPSLTRLAPYDPARPAPSTALMEAHYFSRDCFLEDEALLKNAGRLAGIPGVILQSRFDLLCPPATSARLAALWPEAEIRMIEAAGHSLGHPAVAEAMAEAVRALLAG